MPPVSLSKVLAALRRFMPPFPRNDDDSDVGKELNAFAEAVGHAKDSVDAFEPEIFPDTGTASSYQRWENATRVPSQPEAPIAERRARVLARLRRVAGPQPEKLLGVLAPVLDCEVDELELIEVVREQIDDALTHTAEGPWALSATPIVVPMGKPWPDVVDETGVRLFARVFSDSNGASITVTSPKGTTWNFGVIATEGWYENRTAFLGEPAGGMWTVTASTPLGNVLYELRLRVSNDRDTRDIYNIFVVRDPGLGGAPNLTEAQNLAVRTAHAHNVPMVCEQDEFVHGLSLHGREPHGSL